ncbi:LOW QUALITY PROTEIN: uncharacterized protein [Amphiura filiformis]|uniref:LOW QUALITY PROTEIN: uncharacterized protein n=1 Tax=Amphiura filiformis TaxID=82378 RepID=UPI003B227CB6
MPRRKPQVIRHITQEEESDELPEVDLNPDSADNEEIDIPDEEEADENSNEDADNEVTEVEDDVEVIDDEEEEEVTQEKVKLVNGDSKVEITKDEKGNEILPDGTLVLQPEEVSEENDEFSGPEFKKSKKTVASDLEGTYKCTSCHEQLNHNNPKHVFKHKLLGVLLCRQCHKYLSSGNFDIDDEGSEDQCTWCGEGGNLICCDSCPKAFCRSCIKTNLGRAEISEILADEEEQWLCYVCNPASLADLQEECDKVIFHLKSQAEAKDQKSKPKPVKTGKNKKDKEDEGDELMKMMQLMEDKSSTKSKLENFVKNKSPKGLKKTLEIFKSLKQLSEHLENQIRNKIHDDDEDDDEEKSSTEKEKNKHSTKHAKKGKEAEKAKSKNDDDEESDDGSSESADDDKKKSSKQVKKTAKEKRGKGDKAASSSPSEDDVPGTSSGSVKGNKSGRKGRRSLFKAQQKEKAVSSSDESDESSVAESSVEDSDWEEDSGVKERKRRRASKKGKAGGKLSAKKGKEESSSDDDDSDDNSRRKKKKKSKSKSHGTDSDPEIQFPKKKKKKKGPGKDSSNEEENSSDDDDDSSDKKKKKRTKQKSKKSKDGDISLSSESDEEENEQDESDSGASSAEEDRKKIKKAMQDAKKGTLENKQDLGSDAEDKIAERLLMEEAEEEEEGNKESETSDSDLEDAKKKRDKRNKKKSKKRKNKSGSEDGDEDKKDSDDEDAKKKKGQPKKKNDRKRKKKSGSEDSDEDKKDGDDEEEEDEEPKGKKGKKKSKKKKKHHLLQVGISESEDDEEDGKKKKKRKPAKKKKKKVVDSDDLMTSAESSSDSSDVQPKKKGRKRKGKKDESTEEEADRSYKKKRKRRRIKEAANSGTGSGSGSDEDAKKSGDSVQEASGSGSGDDQDTPGKHRKEIRRVLKKSKLLKTTLEAEVAEKERRDRIKKRRKELFGDDYEPEKAIKLKELVLEYGKNKKDKLVEVDEEIVKYLKPHQVEGVQFLWDSTFESMAKKDEQGGGAILAHCMGLGKTLQIITYLHTIMSYEELNIKRALVVAPLNTVLNWVEEFNKWLSHDDSIDVYEITSVRNNEARADMLEQWHEEGGVLVIGYSMYRILAQNPKLKKKRLKRIFHETLVHPGPGVVVCDEGHMLKNGQTAIAKALNAVRTRRRVCLTGTPLQNNLGEYHCMVDFVKPNLLGSAKEYKNRFVNPITNGQCSDSTSRDVRIMKHRAHILHDLLAGCVQRKDYSVITKFLPPKHEYVLSVRLSPKQVKLYELYLGQYSGMKKDENGPMVQQRSTSVFADYQSLMRIWTHPQVLKLNTIREENKAFNDMDTFVTSEEDSDAGSIDDFIDDQSSNSGVEEVAPVKTAPRNSTRATRSSRRTAAAAPAPAQNGDKGSSDEEDGEDNNKDGIKSDSSLEVITSWKTRSRTLDPEGVVVLRTPTPTLKKQEWYEEHFNPEEDAYDFNLSGKLTLLFEILKYCETIGEKILVFSQSLLSLDLIEDFLEHLNKTAEEERDKGEQDLENQIGGAGAWIKGEDYFRMDGSTSAAYRHRWCDIFNDIENIRARLFLISTKAGSLGVNLVGANRVIIFDASWNPSHDTQSIFRVYRFGQERPVFIYRFVAQGTMEEKIYERQVAKQSLSQRVVDEHQIERHFTSGQLQELYTFTPDRLDDPDREEQPLPALPKDHILADLLKERKDWIVKYHEHDSLLENKIDEELSEEDRKAAWADYNAEKEGRMSYQLSRGPYNTGYAQSYGATPMMLQQLYEDGSSVLQAGQSILGQQHQQQYRNINLNGYNPYGWPSNVYAHSQALLMRQYQQLQQQRQRSLQMMPQGTAGNQSVSQLLANSYGNAAAAPGAYNQMSSLLSRMSQQQAASASASHINSLAERQKSNLYEALKKTADKQNQQQNGNGSVNM